MGVKITRKRLLLGAIAVVVIILIVRSFKKGANPPVTVVKAEVTTNKVVRTVSATGFIHAAKEADLGVVGTGFVDSLVHEVGEQVEEGTILGNIYNSPSAHTIQAARDARDIALRDRDLFIQNYQTNLSAIGGLDEYNIGLRRQNELVSKAEATYKAEVSSLTNTYLQAPFTGTIVDIYIDEGEIASLNSTILKLADLSSYYFEVQLDQADFGEVKQGQQVIVVLDSYEDVELTGEVMALPLYANTTAEDFELKIKLAPTDKKLVMGMKGTAEIIISEVKEQTQALTFDALFSENEKHYVWTVKDGKLVKKYVEVGLEGDIYTQVLTDLSDYQVVIPIDDTNVAEGAVVNYEE